MTVHALELHRLPVHEDRVADDLLLLEADPLHADVVAPLQDERVEVGLFRGPEAGLEIETEVGVGERLQVADLLLIGIIQNGRISVLQLHLETPTLVRAVQRTGADGEVPDAVLRLRPERHVAEDAREAEHVLVLEIAAVRPAEDLHGEEVLSASPFPGPLRQIRRDVELARQLRVLGVADKLAVHPHVIGGIDAVEAQDHVTAVPRLGHVEGRAIGGDGVVVHPARVAVDDLREVLLLRVREVLVRILDVRVPGYAVAAHLDAARHVNRVPVRVVEIGLEEVRRTPRGVADPEDLPVAVQGLPVRRLGLERVRQRRRLVRERHRIGARRQTVDRVDGRILPRRDLLRSPRRTRRNRQHHHRHVPH